MTIPAAVTEYDIGDRPVLTGEFRRRDTNQLATPSTLVVKVMPPSRVEATYTTASTPPVTVVSTGIVSIVLPPVTEPGDWDARFEGDGDLVDAGTIAFVVKPSVFTAAAAVPEGQWISGQSLLTDPRLENANMPPEVTFDMCAKGATRLLWKWTGRRYHFRSVVIRPNQPSCGCAVDACSASSEIRLPGPVDPSSLVVTIDGVVLDPSAYALYDRKLLVRQDGGTWPWCQHLATPVGQPGSWTIEVRYGEGPPMDGILACRELAIHIAMGLSGMPSKIPARATSVSRRGISINLLRGENKTGIPLVDDFVNSENPNRLARRGSVSSPDRIRLSRESESPSIPGYGAGY